MPVFIRYGQIHVQTPQQNAGVCIGETNMAGWDASQKTNMGHAPLFGAHSMTAPRVNLSFDAHEGFSGIVNDADIKVTRNLNL